MLAGFNLISRGGFDVAYFWSAECGGLNDVTHGRCRIQQQPQCSHEPGERVVLMLLNFDENGSRAQVRADASVDGEFFFTFAAV
jgi:hypothetical protein